MITIEDHKIRAATLSKTKFKLANVSMLTVLLLILLSGFYSVSSEKDTLLNHIKVHGDSLTKAAAYYCIKPLLNKNIHVLADYARNTVMERNDVISIQILNAQGSVLAQASSSKYTHEVYTRQFYRDIRINPQDSQTLGRVIIGISTKYYDRLSHQRLIEFGLVAVILIVVLMLSNIFVTKRTLESSLVPINSQIDALINGDLETPITADSGTEIDRLAKNIDTLRLKLRSNISAIKDRDTTLKLSSRLD